DGGSWQNVSGRSGSANVSGDWEENHTIDVQVRNEHGDWSSSSASKSQRAGEDPTPPLNPRIWVEQGASRSCQIGGGTCRTFQLHWEDIPSADRGNHQVSINVTGGRCGDGTFDPGGNPYTENISGESGNTE